LRELQQNGRKELLRKGENAGAWAPALQTGLETK